MSLKTHNSSSFWVSSLILSMQWSTALMSKGIQLSSGCGVTWLALWMEWGEKRNGIYYIVKGKHIFNRKHRGNQIKKRQVSLQKLSCSTTEVERKLHTRSFKWGFGSWEWLDRFILKHQFGEKSSYSPCNFKCLL